MTRRTKTQPVHERLAIGGMLLSTGAVLGVYVAYPAMLWARSRVHPRPIEPSAALPARVSVVIAAYNEAPSIGSKLDDLAMQLLPSGVRSLQVIVASDGSADETVAIAFQASLKR